MSARLKLLVTEAWRSLGANLSTTVAATMTVLISMFLLGLFIGFGTWMDSWSTHVKSELLVKIYFSAERDDQAEEHARGAAAAEPVRAAERRQVRVEGSGARRR